MEELYHDSGAQRHLISSYRQHLQLVAKEDENEALKKNPPTLVQLAHSTTVNIRCPKFVHFSNTFENECKGNCLATFNGFSQLTKPILSQMFLNTMASIFQNTFPDIHRILSCLLHFESKRTLQRKEHLLPFWDRVILYMFLSMMRIRNNHLFDWWAFIICLGRYGIKESNVRGNMSVFFGHSLSFTSMHRRLREYNTRDKVYERCRLLLKKVKKAMVVVLIGINY